jgi:hypothetical protein
LKQEQGGKTVSEKVSEQTPTIEQTQTAPNEDQKVPCEVYSRIVGYVRPVRNWNKGKKQEFSERQTYRVDQDASGDSASGDASECASGDA